MTFWDFVDQHPVYTFFLGVFLLILVEQLGDSIRSARGK